MRIQPDALVAGFPAKKIRELLRQNDHSLSVYEVTKTMGVKGKKASQLLALLESEGLIERNTSLSDPEKECYWKLTLKGRAFAKALFSPPVPRQAAEKKLNEFMARVHQVNADSWFLYRVERVVVFGSFLTGQPYVGDLDLAIQLKPKESDEKKHSDLILARAHEAARNGRQFHNFVEELYFASDEVKRFLKARSRIIQLTDCGDGVLKIAENRVIYEYPGEGNSDKPLA
jgi:DNA-binding MarR family transcriptional regulator